MDAAIDTFRTIAEKDGFVIDYEVADKIDVYLEIWRMKLWDIGFPDVFKRNGFKKDDDFAKHADSTSLVNRVIYRFVYEISFNSNTLIYFELLH